jgi:hypothetical protein
MGAGLEVIGGPVHSETDGVAISLLAFISQPALSVRALLATQTESPRR